MDRHPDPRTHTLKKPINPEIVTIGRLNLGLVKLKFVTNGQPNVGLANR